MVMAGQDGMERSKNGAGRFKKKIINYQGQIVGQFNSNGFPLHLISGQPWGGSQEGTGSARNPDSAVLFEAHSHGNIQEGTARGAVQEIKGWLDESLLLSV